MPLPLLQLQTMGQTLLPGGPWKPARQNLPLPTGISCLFLPTRQLPADGDLLLPALGTQRRPFASPLGKGEGGRGRWLRPSLRWRVMVLSQGSRSPLSHPLQLSAV